MDSHRGTPSTGFRSCLMSPYPALRVTKPPLLTHTNEIAL